MKDERMEELSDLVRRGISIDLRDALAVINYQEELREERNIASKSTLTGKAKAFLNKLKFFR